MLRVPIYKIPKKTYSHIHAVLWSFWHLIFNVVFLKLSQRPYGISAALNSSRFHLVLKLTSIIHCRSLTT